MKNKTWIPFLVILLLIGGGIIFWILNQKQPTTNNDDTKQPNDSSSPYSKEEQEKLGQLDNAQEKLDYFNMDYLDRYLAYQEQNPTLAIEDVITRVNIGLDQPYYTNTKESPYLNQIYLLSNKYLFMPSDYVPDGLEAISSDCARSGMQLVSEARQQFEALCKQAKEDGYTIRAMSSYRSYDYQDNLYQRYVAQDGVEEADTYSARPGFSEHQTGLVVDVDNNKIDYTDFEQTDEFEWMQDHAHEFGFILRYPKGKEDITGYTYEAWHYRYVGEDIATYIHEHDITFDEYYVRFIENKK